MVLYADFLPPPITRLARKSNDNIQCSSPATSEPVSKVSEEGTSASPP
jgi:hypothetical protein